MTEHWPNIRGRATFELSDVTGLYTFTLRGADGEIIVFSRQYKTKASALEAIQSLKRDAPSAWFDLESNAAGEHRFVLRGADGEIIVASGPYETRKAAEEAVQRLKRDAPGAEVVDGTS